MALAVSMFALASAGIFASTLFDLKIRIGKIGISLYWVFPLIVAIVLLAAGGVDAKIVWQEFTSNTAMNPLKILVLFLSMTGLSVYLDEIGFFRWLANSTLKKAGTSQKKLFLLLYIVTSVLTVFTSNDVIILTFTPFICYFAKNCDVDPVPYIFTEFVAANTWSMLFVIGNPTNVYLATTYGITFAQYFKVMAIPTVFAGICSFAILYATFAKKLAQPLKPHVEEMKIEDKPCLVIALVALGICTIMLAISSYIGIEMWTVSLVACAGTLILCSIVTLCQKKSLLHVGKTIVRLPWQLVPFLLSTFIVVLALADCGITQNFADSLQRTDCALSFGTTSALFANVINNIPMSVLYSKVLQSVGTQNLYSALYATVIGSNLGALLTPIGALAAIMWSAILKKHNVRFRFFDFVWRGFLVGVPTLLCAIAGLKLSLAF